MIEGMIRRCDASFSIQHPTASEIVMLHESVGFERALANTFSPSDAVVVIRKSDYDQMVRFARARQ